MDKDFYMRKIRQLSNEKLIELLQHRTRENHEIMVLAEKEASDRGMDLQSLDTPRRNTPTNTSRQKKDTGITWKDILGEIVSGL